MQRTMYVYIYRSAITGQLVSEAYALRYPNITVRERVWRPVSPELKKTA